MKIDKKSNFAEIIKMKINIIFITFTPFKYNLN